MKIVEHVGSMQYAGSRQDYIYVDDAPALRLPAPVYCLLLTLIALTTGCNSWAGRMFVTSLGRITDPIAPAPHMITQPMVPNAELAVGWVGHSTVLIQIKDKVFITDPLFMNSVGIVVKRWVEPGIDPSTIKHVDFTLVSHTHFDHLNLPSLNMLPKNEVLILPPGALQFVPDYGFRDYVELPTWHTFTQDGVQITSVPVQHFSGRYGIDRNWMGDTGYTGYVIQYNGICVYFGGDTGYDPNFFKETGRRFSIDLAIIPIGPGSSRQTGGQIHVSPGGALQIFHELGAKWMLPIHHKTIPYGPDSEKDAPIQTLREMAKEQGISDRIVDLDIGEQRVIIPTKGRN